jgi:hypothetical protein
MLEGTIRKSFLAAMGFAAALVGSAVSFHVETPAHGDESFEEHARRIYDGAVKNGVLSEDVAFEDYLRSVENLINLTDVQRQQAQADCEASEATGEERPLLCLLLQEPAGNGAKTGAGATMTGNLATPCFQAFTIHVESYQSGFDVCAKVVDQGNAELKRKQDRAAAACADAGGAVAFKDVVKPAPEECSEGLFSSRYEIESRGVCFCTTPHPTGSASASPSHSPSHSPAMSMGPSASSSPASTHWMAP